ncbi:unnamed protein product, partial [Allacma fusca]
PRKIQF